MNISRRLPFCLLILFLFIQPCARSQVLSDASGFFMWDEATDAAVIEEVIEDGVNSFRSRDLTILYHQPAWDVFKEHGAALDVMVSIPVYYTYTSTEVDLQALADTINANPFIRRLQIYPKLQPGLFNPSELNPCNDWLTGYAEEFEQRIRQIDALVTDKSVEILVAGQMGTPGCADLTRIINTLYDLQDNGRNVGWGMTVYPFFYGTQDASIETLSADLLQFQSDLNVYTPSGKSVLPLRAIESGWSENCSNHSDQVIRDKANRENLCEFASSVFDYNQAGIKIYHFELQDFPDGWTECEKHFGLYDENGFKKCSEVITAINEVDDMETLVYPTLVDESFVIETAPDQNQRIDLVISKLDGQVVLAGSLHGTGPFNFSVDRIKSGAYLVKVVNGKNNSTHKIFVK